MKILKIKAKNINSLKTVDIDFEEFLKDSTLFAITGSTGSGKSTILDIITCALYGRTPRLKNPEELMRRHTAEAFCEVEFAVKGESYRSSWKIKRARGSATGRIQSAKMELSNIGTAKIITAKKSIVPKEIEALSGLDFDRFVQSMMLAQGSFDAFLRAKESDRSRLLEKITGTQIYADISSKIFEIFAKSKKEIEIEEGVLNSIEMLDGEVLEDKNSLLGDKLKEKIVYDRKRKVLDEIKNWLKRLDILSNDIIEEEESLEELTDRLNLIKEQLGIKESQYLFARDELNGGEKLFLEQTQKIKAVRVIETQIKEHESLVSELVQEKKSIKESEKKQRESFDKLSRELEKLEDKYKEIDRLYSAIEVVSSEEEERRREELKRVDRVLGLITDYKELNRSQISNRTKREELLGEIRTLKKDINSIKTLIDEVEKHKNTLVESRERELLIVKYKEDRAKLVEGEACFLCGSTKHLKEIHEIVDIDKTKSQIDKKESELKKHQQKLKKLERRETKRESEVESIESKLKEESQSIAKIKESIDVESLSISSLESESKEIDRELSAIVEKRKEKDKLLKQRDSASKKFSSKEKKVIESQRESDRIASLKDKNISSLDSSNKKLELLKEEFKSKWREDIEINLYEKEVTKAFKAIEKREKSLKEEFIKLQTEDKTLTQQKKSLEEKLTQKRELLKEHKSKNLTQKSIDEVNQELEAIQKEIDKIQEEIGSLKKELETHAKNSKKFREKIAKLEKKKESHRVWAKLNEMVGSKNGDKFAKFAQGITLDQLISLANRHLQLLTDRYELQRSEETKQLLEMEVIDSFQGDVTRPVSTLSGGESFIVSLSLALGLSELASKNISIDSLFLDEGFGTLDEESLDMALNALGLLQNSGKMVGVISHVEALKERIPLQIRVVAKGDGSSFVEC